MNFLHKTEAFYRRKYIRIPLNLIILGFAAYGFILTSAYFAVKWHLTDDPGTVDANDRYYSEMAEKYGDTGSVSYSVPKNEAAVYYKIAILYQYAPLNAQLILNTFNKTRNIRLAESMFDAVNAHLQDNKNYLKMLGDAGKISLNYSEKYDSNLFRWMNMEEWTDYKIIMNKEVRLLDSVGKITGIEPRLIAAMVSAEQIRLFDNNREAYKKWIGPLKILSVQSKFSWGVTGIKPETAIKIEKFLKCDTSVFYLGEKYSHLLDFKTADTEKERFDRLTDFHNHFYSYLYAALNLRMIIMQWKHAGYDITKRPEILATLFNLGFEVSRPKPNPRVGGSGIIIKGHRYTFGTIAYEFYYSGELIDLFPYWEKKYID